MTLSAAKRLAPLLILAAFGLDQLSKTWAHSFVGPGNVIAVFPGFNLVAITNSGVAFGLAGEAAPAILIAIGVLLSGMLGIWLIRTRSPIHALGLSLAIGARLARARCVRRRGSVCPAQGHAAIARCRSSRLHRRQRWASYRSSACSC
ncbi:hypothetical protein BA950_04245 [Erythrobacter sp. SAORIC-644]|jgi:hypothetical protein|uniref:signal peptidase II n=1 Tax=Erythrobacteraceae TaxID=335929 RepID=UPI000C9F57BC|nr:hypothetical protein BA950_04245 [Erythrobacter sp. SAORIC-644]HBR83795.1 hypothetical protein [Erythrobacter sp.]